MSEEHAKYMFETLGKNFGKKLKCVYVENGQVNIFEGMLHGLIPYIQVKIGPHGFPFVGEGLAIISISENDHVLYYNPFVKETYKGYDGEMEKVSEAMFGKAKEEALEAYVDGRNEPPTAEEVIADYNFGLKYYLRRGKELIKGKDLQQEFELACKSIVNDYDGIVLFKVAFEIIDKLANATNCEEVLESVKAKYDVSDELLARAIHSAAHYSPHGEVLLQYWNALYSPQEISGKKM